MIATSNALVNDRPQLTFVHRATAWLATGAAVWVLFELGWPIARPADPQAPLSLWSGGVSGLAAVQIGGLAIGCAVLATLMIGRRLADIGVFAAAAGLIALSFRGDTAEYFQLELVASGAENDRVLAGRFFVESLLWMAVLAVCVFVSGRLATRRLHGPAETAPGHRDPSRFIPLQPAICDIGSAAGNQPAPGEGQPARREGQHARREGNGTSTPSKDGAASEPARSIGPTVRAAGVTHAAIVAVVSLFAFLLLSVGSSYRTVAHAQAVFTAAAAVALGCYFAFQFVPVRSAFWPMVGAGAMIVAAYLWTVLRPTPWALPPTIPASPFLRVLPIQFVSAALAAAVAMSWHMYQPPRDEPERNPTPTRR